MASKDISVGEEMLSWYGEKYAKKLGMKGAKKARTVVQGNEVLSGVPSGGMWSWVYVAGHLNMFPNPSIR